MGCRSNKAHGLWHGHPFLGCTPIQQHEAFEQSLPVFIPGETEETRRGSRQPDHSALQYLGTPSHQEIAHIS